MPTRILLVRHGGTIWSSDEKFAGSSDIDLSEEGRQQALALGRRLADVKIEAAYCSPMRRAQETCQRSLGDHRIEMQLVPALREIDHGHWEGHTHSQVRQQFPEEYSAWQADPFMSPPPGGESGLCVLARALPALRKIVADHPNQTVLVVSHKATNRLLLCSLLGIDQRLYRDKFTQDLACLNVIQFHTAAQARVLLLNDTSHYETIA